MKNSIFLHKNGYGGHVVFLNELKVIPSEALLTRNKPSKFKKASTRQTHIMYTYVQPLLLGQNRYCWDI